MLGRRHTGGMGSAGGIGIGEGGLPSNCRGFSGGILDLQLRRRRRGNGFRAHAHAATGQSLGCPVCPERGRTGCGAVWFGGDDGCDNATGDRLPTIGEYTEAPV